MAAKERRAASPAGQNSLLVLDPFIAPTAQNYPAKLDNRSQFQKCFRLKRRVQRVSFKAAERLMKPLTTSLATVLLLASVGISHAFVRIAGDRGGRIGDYQDKYQSLRGSGETVVIDGLCASACTIVLGATSQDRICVTTKATLGFHAAWDYGPNGHAVADPEATQLLYSLYPPQVQRWISYHGGLTRHMIFLRGKPLEAMYRACSLKAERQSMNRDKRQPDR
jgi:hypothetical protein